MAMRQVERNGYRHNIPADAPLPPGAVEIPEQTISPSDEVEMTQEPTEDRAPTALDPNAQIASDTELATIPDINRPVYSAPTQGGNIPTTSSVSVEGAVPGDPSYRQYRALSHAQKKALADARGDWEIRKSVEGAAQLRESAASQALDIREKEAQVAELESTVQQETQELDQTIRAMRDHWSGGGSGANVMGDGAMLGNMFAVMGIMLAGTAGPEYQRNAMNMFNAGLERSIRAQEFTTNSMFRRLEQKYDDRDQARDALKMMQIQYAKTIADAYAMDNMAPEVALKVAEIQNQLDDLYWNTEDKFRREAMGKIKRTQNARYQPGSSGGYRSPTEKEKQDRLRTAKMKVDLLGDTRKFIGGEESQKLEERMETHRPQTSQIAAFETGLDIQKNALIEMGAVERPDGTLDTSALESDGAPGVYTGKSLVPKAFELTETSRVRNMLEQAVYQKSLGERGTRPSEKAVKEEVDRIIGGFREGQQIDSLVNNYKQSQAKLDAMKQRLLPDDVRAEYQLRSEEASRAARRYNRDEGLRGEDEDL